jgi:hypothetical protein
MQMNKWKSYNGTLENVLNVPLHSPAIDVIPRKKPVNWVILKMLCSQPSGQCVLLWSALSQHVQRLTEEPSAYLYLLTMCVLLPGPITACATSDGTAKCVSVSSDYGQIPQSIITKPQWVDSQQRPSGSGGTRHLLGRQRRKFLMMQGQHRQRMVYYNVTVWVQRTNMYQLRYYVQDQWPFMYSLIIHVIPNILPTRWNSQ